MILETGKVGVTGYLEKFGKEDEKGQCKSKQLSENDQFTYDT